MIDYKEMEKVISNLNEYVNRFQKTVETQQKLDSAIEEIKGINDNIYNIKNTISDYTKSIEKIEDDHNSIKSQFDNVLHDYKNLHSAFDFLETKLKGIDIQNDIVKKQLEEARGRLVDLNQQIQEQNKNARKTKIWFGLISVLLVGILLVSIVGLFL